MTTADSIPYNFPRNSGYAFLNSPVSNELNVNSQAPPATYVPNAPQQLKKRTIGSEQEQTAKEKKKGKDEKQRMSDFDSS